METARNVPLSAESFRRHLVRQWFPQSLEDLCRVFDCQPDDAILLLDELAHKHDLVCFHHEIRDRTVYCFPNNPHAPGNFQHDSTKRRG